MRKIFDFHGGIHPVENKHQSMQVAIRQAGLADELVLPLSQHIGAPAQAIVSVGQHVLKGQIIAEPAGFVSVPCHAPTSGEIVAIEKRKIAHPSGFTAPCIVLRPDGKEQWTDLHPTPDYLVRERHELVDIIRNAGIAGMGGAGFPTAVKLSPKPDTKINTLIINGTECEPYITADDILMRERATQIVAGARILAHIVQPDEVLIGVEDNKPEGIAALAAAVAESQAEIEVVTFPTKYPSGGEKQLIEILTGKQVPSGGLPIDVGIVCQNVGSAVAIYDAVVHGKPLISRVTTVTGEAVSEPGNFDVLLGTPVSHLLAQAGYETKRNRRLVMGGPMMGFTLPDTSVPVVKTTNCILAPTEQELPTPPPAQACIRCGMCAEACPASLLPQQLFWFAQGKEFEKLEQHNLFDCIECGACSYVCPSTIPLVQYYRAAKAEIVTLRQDHEKSEQSRLRFEARQERLEQEELEKNAKREARKKAAEARAAQGGADEDPIQAAIDRAKAKKAAQQSDTTKPESEQATLEASIATISKRLATAQEKLDTARTEGSDLVDALQTGVDKTRAKLEAAQLKLQALDNSEKPTPATTPPVDAAQAAIERAMAARKSAEVLTPEQKVAAQRDKLQQQMEKAATRLEKSRESGEEEKIITALESTIARLQGKLADLNTAEQDS
ncbi:MAG: electron transport complex subunit RsxC [Halioglobus sp.]